MGFNKAKKNRLVSDDITKIKKSFLRLHYWDFVTASATRHTPKTQEGTPKLAYTMFRTLNHLR